MHYFPNLLQKTYKTWMELQIFARLVRYATLMLEKGKLLHLVVFTDGMRNFKENQIKGIANGSKAIEDFLI